MDLGALIGIPSTVPVRAFDCQQANDLSLSLVVAVGTDDAPNSNVFVVKPFVMSPTPAITVLPVQTTKKVFQVYLVGFPILSLAGLT